ncbi:MAG: hypothetical protein KDA31_02540 [Phycisphaerales bacterium]|nr:hypothetical protein [Phycisphaerales bacterium]MCB9837014.1 hypothetical protein [Phycisphaera sp.]
MLWEIYQQSRIHAASAQAESASRKSGEIRSAVYELENRTDRLALTTMAMWALMSEKLGITEQELEDKITEIDLSDGKLDGKVRVEAQSCPSCGRKLSKRHHKCMYCGTVAGDTVGRL